MRAVYTALIFLLGGGIGAVVASMWLHSERSRLVETVQVDILSADEMAMQLEKRQALERLLRAPNKGADRTNPTYVVSEAPAQFIIQPSMIYDVRFLPGSQFFIRADSGKVLLLVDDSTAFCVETYAKARPQRKLRVSTCDNKEARMTAGAKVEAATGAKVETTKE